MDCPAITNGVTIFPDGNIRPCCRTAAEYSKPLENIKDPYRFKDIAIEDKPMACKACWEAEDKGFPSLRNFYIERKKQDSRIQFIDFRLSNQCNLKCRYCGPHFSNQWAKELSINPSLRQTDITDYYKDLLNENLTDIYWGGGEPLIIKDHYEINNLLIKSNLSKNINLRYNTNLTVLKYKDIDILEQWKNFKSVTIDVSLDATSEVLNYIRSGSSWQEINSNINSILKVKNSNLILRLTPVISIMNIWFLPELMQYAKEKKLKVLLCLLDGPDYLSLGVLPYELKQQVKELLEPIKMLPDYKRIIDALDQNNEHLFDHTIRHILLLDSIRNEKLFQFLPFKKYSINKTLKNHEYE